jgi:hypothetical protein
MAQAEHDLTGYITCPLSDKHLIYPEKGTVINKKSGKFIGSLTHNGYFQIAIKRKQYVFHRFMYECVHGSIPTGMDIDHINDIRADNRIENLQCLTHLENIQKSLPNRNTDFLKQGQIKSKPVMAYVVGNGTGHEYPSMAKCAKALEINVGQIKMICDGSNRCKTARSKVDEVRYRFEYVS